jgi:hypothetical protein
MAWQTYAALAGAIYPIALLLVHLVHQASGTVLPGATSHLQGHEHSKHFILAKKSLTKT